MDPEKIGKFILTLRKEKDLSQYQLADMIPISRQAVSKWERGKTTPDSQTLLRLSDIFNVTVNELLIGERILDDSIQSLEETTLSIVDESNKKTKKIKRISLISISIITILLLLFLSYYFINSYKTTEVYRVGNTNGKFTVTDGVFIKTKEKYYLKLSTVKSENNDTINNIKLYYKKNNKKIIIIEDKDVDKLTIMDTYGYNSKLSDKDINKIKNNLYLEITYNDNKTSTMKLRFIKDFTNKNLFFIKQSKETKEEVKEEPKVEEEKKEEETKPTINETPKQEEEKPKETQPVEQPQEVQITPELIISKIKEKGINTNGTYIYEVEDKNTIFIYYETMELISVYVDDEPLSDYQINVDEYVCSTGDCETKFKNTIKESLIN